MYSITLAKTLTRRIRVTEADDFDSAAEWARDHLDDIDFGEGAAFWVEAIDDCAGEAVIAQGAEQ